MAIVRHNGKIITHGGKIGTGEGCCCGEQCDPCELFGNAYYDAGPHIVHGSLYGQPGVWAGGVGPAGGAYAFNPSTGNWSSESGFPVAVQRLMRSDGGELYDCAGPWTPAEAGNPYYPYYSADALIAAYPPPDDGEWYVCVIIDPYIAWYPACAPRPCVPEFQGGDEYAPLVLDSFQFTGVDCPENICCNGNDPYPSVSPTESCGHQNWVFGAPPGAPQAICLGACCGDVDPTQGPPLIALSIQSCFGSGAAASVTAPAGNPSLDAGPLFLAGLSLDAGGSGYAKLGRVFPTVSVGGGSGSGATFTPTVLPYPYVNPDACDLPGWRITAVTPSGGTGYVDGEQLTVSVAAGDTAEVAAVVTVHAVRSQPTLSASVSGGTGATLTVSTSSNGTTPQTWGVSGVSVGGTTSGYTDGAAVTFSYGAHVTEQTKATAIIKTVRTEPTVTASASGGSGASLTVNLSQSPTTPSDTALWHVDSVTVADGGTGYTDGDPVTFTVTDGTEVVAAAGTVDVRPTLDAYVADTSGTGATLTPTLSQSGEYWTVTGVTIGAAGTGYEVDQLIPFTPTGTSTEIEAGVWIITSVDGNGGITGVAPPDEISSWGGVYDGGAGPIERIILTGGGDYYKPTSAISRVVVTDGGQYFYYDGTPTSCTVTNGGFFYREDADEPPLVAPVSVLITQTAPSAGINGSIGVVIDDDPQSASFGVITGLTVVGNGGTGYLAWAWDTECANGQTKAECEASGGTWHSGAPCNSYPCNVFP